MTRPGVVHGDGEAGNVPDVDHHRCVHTRIVSASCRACADACPLDAWVIDDDIIGIDVERCDGCGICAAACPTTAIRLAQAPAQFSHEQPDTALVACRPAVPEGASGVRACLNAIGLDELAALYHQGMRRLLVCREACAKCPRGTAPAFDEAWSGLARLLADRGLGGVTLEALAPAQWRAAHERAARLSRRGFLMALRPRERPRQAAADDDHDAANDARPPTACEHLAGAAHDAEAALAAGAPRLTPFTPAIDPETCTACDACARICPSAAITLEAPPGAAHAYHLTPDRCTACRMCLDVCEAGAVTIGEWRHAGENRVQLDASQCARCGNVFRTVALGHEPPAVCPLCASSRHNANLFQVLE